MLRAFAAVYPLRRTPLLQRARACRGAVSSTPHCLFDLPTPFLIARWCSGTQDRRSTLTGDDRPLLSHHAADEPLPSNPDPDFQHQKMCKVSLYRFPHLAPAAEAEPHRNIAGERSSARAPMTKDLVVNKKFDSRV